MEALQILSPEVRGTSEAEGVCENGKLLAIGFFWRCTFGAL